MSEIETKNAVIEDAAISNDDHGLLSAWLTLDYGGCCQAFGGYALYLPASFRHHPHQPNFAGHFIWRVMEVAGVSKWDDLAGKTIRVRASMSKVEAVGHNRQRRLVLPAEGFRRHAAHGEAVTYIERAQEQDALEEWLHTAITPDVAVVSVCCWDNYCIEPVEYRCPCCELTFCAGHTHGSGLCLDCQDWCERNEEMA